MKLFLASEAKHPESMKKLETFVGGFEGKNIAYIPTAVNADFPCGEWRTDSKSWETVNTLGANVEAVVLEEYRNASVVEALKNKDIIWFAGGMCGYLMYWVRRCQLDIHLPMLLDSGSLYVGSSAGSMICSPTLDVAEYFPGEEEHGAHFIPGLGLIDFDIFPHYEDDQLDTIKALYTGKKLYMLKNGEAITVVDGQVTVLGEERIISK